MTYRNGVTDQPRPTHPTVAQIREVCQPPAIRGRTNSEHWVADVYLRDISPYLTKQLLKTPITANQVTWLMVQMLWDCCDGEVARWRRKSSPMGVFIDRGGHYTTEGLIPIALGLRAAGFPNEGWLDSIWPFLGALLSVIILYNKALNDMVHVSRAYNDLPKLVDKAEVGVPTNTGIRNLRSLAKFFPFQRAYHSVELTILILIAGIIDLFIGELGATRVLLVALLGFGVITIVGHLASILTSSKLR